ncbi:hypothetical protein [Microbispora sp. NPDC049633]|uniref:hypothetical protein n=1 Tax=Microbispora sp. NPDC049633 TaxID=3154355 RepID=UPI003412DD90
MRRLALVSGLSVLLAVGVTTGGARLIAGRTSLTMEQPTTACPVSEDCTAAGAPGSGQALGETRAPGDPTGGPAQNGQDQPGQEDPGRTGAGQDEGGSTGKNDTAKNDTAKNDTAKNDTAGNDTARGGSADPQATPVSTATSGDPDRDHASARTRAPSTTAPRAASTTAPRAASTTAPRASSQASPRVGDAPAAVTAAGDDTATVPGADAAPGDNGTSEDTAGTDAAQTESALDGDGAAVRVRFTVRRHDESGYTARLAVRNEGPALPDWTIRLAVGGQVTAVEGADWEQRGDTLTLNSRTALDEGGALTLTIQADGAPAAPADCVLSGGRCEVTGPGPSRRHG